MKYASAKFPLALAEWKLAAESENVLYSKPFSAKSYTEFVILMKWGVDVVTEVNEWFNLKQRWIMSMLWTVVPFRRAVKTYPMLKHYVKLSHKLGNNLPHLKLQESNRYILSYKGSCTWT